MSYTSKVARSVALALVASISPWSAARAQAILYTMRFPEPNSHVAEVEARIPTGGKPSLDLMLPVWSPGYYAKQDYARNVQEFAATSNGAQLPVEKPQPNHWSRGLPNPYGRSSCAPTPRRNNSPD